MLKDYSNQSVSLYLNLAKKISILFCCVFVVTTRLCADNTALYSFDKAELRALNANNLSDLLGYFPLLSTIYSDNQQISRLGSENLNVCAIYKDGFPMFMDQNIEVNYQAISLNDVERVEIQLPDIASATKGLNTVNIYLYTSAIDTKASDFQINLQSNSLSDGNVGVSASLSNLRHSFGLYFSRYFENGIQQNTSRKHVLPSYTNHFIGFKYNYKFLRNASLKIDYSTRMFDLLSRSEVFNGTSRVEDYNEHDLIHRLNTRVKMKLSKNHSLEFAAQYTLNNQYHFNVEKDLSNNISERLAVSSLLDSTKNQLINIKSIFTKLDTVKRYSYSLSVEYSNFNDLFNRSIDAIPVAYNDYTLAGSLDYQPFNSVYLGVGLNYLSNSVLGNYVLPRFFVSLRPSSKLHLEFRHINTVLYPFNSAVFYSAAKTNSLIENNLRLEAGRFAISQMLLQLRENNLLFESGFLLANHSNGVKENYELFTYTNGRQASSLITYFSVNYSTDRFVFNPIFAIKASNDNKELIDQNFYSPELTFKSSYLFEDIGLRVFAFGKVSGATQTIIENADGNFENRLDEIQLLNFSVSKTFFNSKWNVFMGVNNIFNSFAVNYDTYNINQGGIDRIGGMDAYASRGRNIFMRLNISLE